MQIPLLDLTVTYAQIRDEIRAAIDEVCDSQQFILGPKVEALEATIASYCGTQYACGVSSGTDALLMALMAEGIGPNDEVITTPFTFFATAGAISRVGAEPVFVDIDPVTFNISPQSIEDRITRYTKAIIPVHLFGQPADMDAIVAVAERFGLTIIEDAAQAIGAEYKGKRVGGLGSYGCFSFFPSKNLGAFGDGGIITCQDENRLQKLRQLRVHGAEPKYYHSVIGGNFRLDALQAAIVSAKFPHLDTWTAQRQNSTARYARLFAGSGVTNIVSQPQVAEYCTRHVFNQYCIRIPEGRRDEIRERLRQDGIGAEIYYPVPLHQQACFAELGYRPEDCPVSSAIAREILAIPNYPGITEAQQAHVVDRISAAWHHGS